MARTEAYHIPDRWEFFRKEKNVPPVSFRSLKSPSFIFVATASVTASVSSAPSCKLQRWAGISVNSGFVGHPSRVRLKTGHRELSFTTFGSPTALGRAIWRHPARKPQVLLLSPDTTSTSFCRCFCVTQTLFVNSGWCIKRDSEWLRPLWPCPNLSIPHFQMQFLVTSEISLNPHSRWRILIPGIWICHHALLHGHVVFLICWIYLLFVCCWFGVFFRFPFFLWIFLVY